MSPFVFVSRRLCLDLAGTVLWRRTRATELLTDEEALSTWIIESGLLTRVDPLQPGALERVRSLREASYRIVREWLGGEAAYDGAALARVNAAAQLPMPRIVMDPSGALTRTGGSTEVMSAASRDLIELLASDARPRLRECSHAECTRIFLDDSRGRARRWCGMAECGNKEKAAAYRRRRSAAPDVSGRTRRA